MQNLEFSYLEGKGVPPGGLTFFDEQSGVEIKGDLTISQAARKVRRARKTGSHPDIVVEIGNSVCQHLAPEQREKYCIDVQRQRTLKEEVFGAVAWGKIKTKAEASYVPLSEANRRAQICLHCPLNVHREGEAKREKFENDKMKAAVGGRSTSHDARLRSCGVCTCPLKPKVHLALEIARTGYGKRELDQFPHYCWMVEGVQQSANAKGRDYAQPAGLKCSSCSQQN